MSVPRRAAAVLALGLATACVGPNGSPAIEGGSPTPESGRVQVLPGAGSTVFGSVPARTDRAGSGAFQVGAARVDITPVPGIPMTGYAIAGKLSRGFWTRLHARALYLEDASGQPLVLVSCELAMIPNGLADRVAEIVSKDLGLSHVGREQIVLAATHTHHGPSNFFTSRMYSSFASQKPGFDRAVFEFLAHRIAAAIARAEQARRPAVLRVPKAADVAERRNWLPGFFRNRAFGAFRLNPEARPYLQERAPVPASALPGLEPCLQAVVGYPDEAACMAVRPEIEFVEFVEATGGGAVIGMAVFLAAHATVLDPQSEVYAGDVFGVASTLLEKGLVGDPSCPAGGELPVVALFNGAEGDVSPMWVRRDRREVLDLARSLASRVCEITPGSPEPAPTLGARFAVIGPPLSGRSFPDQSSRAFGYPRELPDAPEPGAALIGGAPDGRTLFFELGHHEEFRDPMRDAHGAKLAPLQVALGPLEFNLAKTVFQIERPPSRAPLGVYRLGDTVLVALPGEFTTIMGERVRSLVQAALTTPADRVLLLGLANGHVSYFPTPEEYDAQYYEGASSVYGAQAGPLLAYELATLASQLPSSTPPAHRSFFYTTGSPVTFGPSRVGHPPYWVDDGLAAIVQEPASRFPRRDFPTFCWIEPVPHLGDPPARILPDVAIHAVVGGTPDPEPFEAGGAVQDNHGLDLVTVVAGVDVEADQMEWCAIWMTPEGVAPTAQFRFQVAKASGETATSESFAAGEVFLARPTESPLQPQP